jgi:hypothetical protein
VREGWPIADRTSHIATSQQANQPRCQPFTAQDAATHGAVYTPSRQRLLDRGDVKTRRTREPLFDAAHSLVLAAGAGGGDGVLTWSSRPRASQSMKHPRPRLHAGP